jgi:hypothetical protein
MAEIVSLQGGHVGRRDEVYKAAPNTLASGNGTSVYLSCGSQSRWRGVKRYGKTMRLKDWRQRQQHRDGPLQNRQRLERHPLATDQYPSPADLNVSPHSA